MFLTGWMQLLEAAFNKGKIHLPSLFKINLILWSSVKVSTSQLDMVEYLQKAKKERRKSKTTEMLANLF